MPVLYSFLIWFIRNTGSLKVLIYMFKDAETPVIELLEQEPPVLELFEEEPNEDSVTITTGEESLFVGGEQGQ